MSNQKSLHPILSSSSSDEASNHVSPNPTGATELKPDPKPVGTPVSKLQPAPTSSMKKTGLKLGLNVIGRPPPQPVLQSPQSSETTFDESIISSPLQQQHQQQPQQPQQQPQQQQPQLSPPSVAPDSPTTPKRQQNTESVDDLSSNLRMLAAKEMEVLEVGEKIKELMDTKRAMEQDLERLKKKVEQALVQQMQGPTKPKNLFDRSPLRPRSRSPKRRAGDDDDRKGWSNNLFSKPLNFLQQFDNIIQNEFEKLQIPGHEERESHSSSSSFDNLDYSKEINEPIKNLANQTRSQEVVNSVTNQLWSFVNDVKSNLLNHDDSDDSPELQRTLSPGKLRSRQTPASPSRNRTPSISNRRHYGQYSSKKKYPQSEEFANVVITDDGDLIAD